MKPIKFKESNITFAENQPEYLPLPAFLDPEDKEGRVISCWELTFVERVKVLFTGRIYFNLFTFGKPPQPQSLEVDSPFINPENK